MLKKFREINSLVTFLVNTYNVDLTKKNMYTYSKIPNKRVVSNKRVGLTILPNEIIV